MMTRRMTILALLLALTAVPFLAAPAHAQTNPFQGIPVAGTIVNGGTLTGTLNVTRFVAQGGVMYAVGTLSGTLTDAAGNLITTLTNQPVQLPITAASGSCPILNLTLGPLDLTLLGLNVHLNQVVLNITATSGPGNLLGNLLCAVAGLLDANNVNGIVRLLNQILGAL